MNIKKWFSLSWLKSRNISKEERIVSQPVSKIDNLIFTGNDIIVIKGKNIISVKADLRKFLEVKDIEDYEELLSLLYQTVVDSTKKIDSLVEEYVNEGKELIPVNLFEGDPFFQVMKNGDISVKGLNGKAIPAPVLASFVELLETPDSAYALNALKMFAIKLLLNPDDVSISHAVAFIKKYNVKITPKGNIILFREIKKVTDNVNAKFNEYVSKEWLKIKGWKKSPKDYFVVSTDNTLTLAHKDALKNKFSGDKSTINGVLDELYKNLSKSMDNHYTDAHTQSYVIKLGDVYRIRPEHLRKNMNGSCGGALHVASGCKDGYDYSGFGGTPVCVLVDPRNIFRMDTGFSGKIGVKEMFILGVTQRNDSGNFIHLSDELVNDFDDAYNLSINENDEFWVNVVEPQELKEKLSSNVVEIC
jgi:transcription termination factor NusB